MRTDRVDDLAALRFGWGKLGDELPPRPDAMDFAREVEGLLEHLTEIHDSLMTSVALTPVGTVVFRWWLKTDDRNTCNMEVLCQNVAKVALLQRMVEGEAVVVTETARGAQDVVAAVENGIEWLLRTHHCQSLSSSGDSSRDRGLRPTTQNLPIPLERLAASLAPGDPRRLVFYRSRSGRRG